MKKNIAVLIVIIILIFIPNTSNAIENNKSNENSVNQDDIISSQKASLDIGGFISQAKKYTEDIFEDTDYNELLNSAIKGDIDNEKFGKSILSIARKRNYRFYKNYWSNHYNYSYT